MSIQEMLKNIDELSDKARNFKVTKNDFIDTLQQINAEKF